MSMHKLIALHQAITPASTEQELLTEYVQNLQYEKKALENILSSLANEQNKVNKKHTRRLNTSTQVRLNAVNGKLMHSQDIPTYKLTPLISDNCHEAISFYTLFWLNVPRIERTKKVDQLVTHLLKRYSDSKRSLPQGYTERKRRGTIIGTL